MTATALLASKWRDVPKDSRSAAFDAQLTAWGFWVRCLKDNPTAEYDSKNILYRGPRGDIPDYIRFPRFDVEEQLDCIWRRLQDKRPRQAAAVWSRFARKGGDPELLDMYNAMCFAWVHELPIQDARPCEKKKGYLVVDETDYRPAISYKVRKSANYYRDLWDGKQYMRAEYEEDCKN